MNLLKKVKWIDLPSKRDERGVLTSIEGENDIPFAIKRIFYMHHIITDRGGHAHLETEQIVIAISGSFKLQLSDGIMWETYKMNRATKGLYIPKMVFIKIQDFSADAVCLVLASTHYDINKSIRNWEEYLRICK